MKVLNDIIILIFSSKVGEDQYGNKYYESNNKCVGKRKKRFVRYNGIVESSKVPPMWHAWLHYIEEKVPAKKRRVHEWQKSHIPNLTGTVFATKPKASISKSGERQKSHADYEPWKP